MVGMNELYRLGESRMMKVDVTSKRWIRSWTPEVLFRTKLETLPRGDTNFDVGPDGRFLAVIPIPLPGLTRCTSS